MLDQQAPPRSVQPSASASLARLTVVAILSLGIPVAFGRIVGGVAGHPVQGTGFPAVALGLVGFIAFGAVMGMAARCKPVAVGLMTGLPGAFHALAGAVPPLNIAIALALGGFGGWLGAKARPPDFPPVGAERRLAFIAAVACVPLAFLSRVSPSQEATTMLPRDTRIIASAVRDFSSGYSSTRVAYVLATVQSAPPSMELMRLTPQGLTGWRVEKTYNLPQQCEPEPSIYSSTIIANDELMRACENQEEQLIAGATSSNMTSLDATFSDGSIRHVGLRRGGYILLYPMGGNSSEDQTPPNLVQLAFRDSAGALLDARAPESLIANSTAFEALAAASRLGEEGLALRTRAHGVFTVSTRMLTSSEFQSVCGSSIDSPWVFLVRATSQDLSWHGTRTFAVGFNLPVNFVDQTARELANTTCFPLQR